MAQDTNIVMIYGAISRSDVIEQAGSKVTSITLGGYRNLVGSDGRARKVPFYQAVTVRFKEGEEAAKLPLGTPVMAEGTLHYSEWDDRETGKKRRKTQVRARTLRAVHGTDESRVVADAKGQPMLEDGYARAIISANVSRDPKLHTFNGGQVVEFGLASSDRWYDRRQEKDVDHTNWLSGKAWNEVADKLMELDIKKGCSIMVFANIENGKPYDDREGSRVFPVDLNIYEFIPRGRMGEAASATYPEKSTSQYTNVAADFGDEPLFDDFAPEEELPF